MSGCPARRSRTTCCAPPARWPRAIPAARTATLRRHLVAVPARIAHRGRDRIVLHLPEHWPWYDPWDGLFEATHRTHRAPPARAA